jgi:uncharacterized protein (TIGR04255 family)
MPSLRADVDRPDDLPEFLNPPLYEVVLGVQFAPARGYSQIRAGEVWGLFKSSFPLVEEHSVLPPMFETFGRPERSRMQLDFIAGARHDRFWFLTPDKNELIQFQQDRLLHNWRKIAKDSKYPRFERMFESFAGEIRTLEHYFASLAPQTLTITQCEIVYINHIPSTLVRGNIADWLRFVTLRQREHEDFAITIRSILPGKESQPAGRLTMEAATALIAGETVLRFGLAVRGAPERADIQAALDFLRSGREIIVRAFTENTTDSAHREWQRVK